MGKRFLWVACVSFIVSFTIIGWTSARIIESTTPEKSQIAAKANPDLTAELFNKYVANIYQTAKLSKAGLDSAVFEKAVTGFYNLKMANKLAPDCSVLTVVDLNKSSCSKRMWIVDLKKMHLVLNTWVAHGEGSGGDIADQFSNDVDSYESSLGFYITNNVYQGKHGLSLRLDGMDEGFNDQASKRDIVVHAAPYVSQSSIRQLGRLGRSQGCPAVSPLVLNKVINAIKGKTVMFVNGNDSAYTSKYLDRNLAANVVKGQDSPAIVNAAM